MLPREVDNLVCEYVNPIPAKEAYKAFGDI